VVDEQFASVARSAGTTVRLVGTEGRTEAA
jgi:hypothetical protein